MEFTASTERGVIDCSVANTAALAGNKQTFFACGHGSKYLSIKLEGDFPRYTLVQDNLFREIGVWEKQSSAFFQVKFGVIEVETGKGWQHISLCVLCVCFVCALCERQ